jgi:hypothetical protein
MIAALYVDPRGPYPQIPGADCWDERRDAKRYDGPNPVVAHPPCGPWSKLRHLCTRQDPECGPRAVAQVRAHGGVLEHPEHSKLFAEFGLPVGHESPDDYGGRTYLIRQVAWGHVCEKPTWLYVVGVPPKLVLAGIRTGGVATHCVCTGPRQRERLPVASKPLKRRTPPLLALWLVSLAEAVIAH